MSFETKYGNITLSQLAHFIVEVCGKDVLIGRNIVTDSEINDAYKEKGSFLKFHYTDKYSIFGKIKEFFCGLEKEYELPLFNIERKCSLDGSKFENIEISSFNFFYSNILWNYIISICGTRPFENTQNNFSKTTLYKLLSLNEINVKYIAMLSDVNFNQVFTEFTEQSRLKFEEFYSQVETFIESDKEDNHSYVKRALEKARKNNETPTWKIFKPFLKAVHKINKKYTNIFLDLYFYTNFKKALDFISIKKQDWIAFENFCKSGYSISEALPAFIKENTNQEQINQISKFGSYFDELTSSNSKLEIAKFKEDYNDLRTEIPHSIIFWQNWFAGKDFVFKYLDSGETEYLEKAVSWYLKALNEGKYFAGKSLEKFIHEAIAVSMYCAKKTDLIQARNRIQKTSSDAETKTPLDKNSKVFYDFGLAFDLLLNEMSDSFNLYYNCENHFNSLFPAESEKAKNIQGYDLLKSAGIEIIHYKDEKDLKEQLKKQKEDLLKIKYSNINKILPQKQNVAYTPITWAIACKYFDIVELFLDKEKYPYLDLNIPSTNNFYPFHEIVIKYNQIKEPETKERLRKIAFQMLERTDKKSLFAQTNKNKISVLETVINSFDLELNKAVLDKMFGENGKIPKDFIISADEVPPLYFLLQSKYFCLKPNEIFAKMGIGSLNYKNLNVSGFTAEQKADNIQNLYNDPMFKAFLKAGGKDSYKSQCGDTSKIEEILDFYIKRTEDLDVIKYSKNEFRETNQGCTALLYACEMDDVETCRKLINAGADLRKQVGTFFPLTTPSGSLLELPNNFIYRAICFKSWNCLEMFFYDYKNIAQEYMHAKDIFMTPLVFFLIWLLNEIKLNPKSIYENSKVIERFVQLFQSTGANINEPTIWGTAETIIRSNFEF